jgi:hypothetical protein
MDNSKIINDLIEGLILIKITLEKLNLDDISKDIDGIVLKLQENRVEMDALYHLKQQRKNDFSKVNEIIRENNKGQINIARGNSNISSKQTFVNSPINVGNIDNQVINYGKKEEDK